MFVAAIVVSTEAELQSLQACSYANGAVEIRDVTADGAVWAAALGNLAVIEHYLLVDNCSGFEWSHLAQLQAVGSARAELLLEHKYAVALCRDRGAVAPVTEPQLLTLLQNQLVGGQIHVASTSGNFCVQDDPAEWWRAVDKQILMEHSVAACGACHMVDHGTSS